MPGDWTADLLAEREEAARWKRNCPGDIDVEMAKVRAAWPFLGGDSGLFEGDIFCRPEWEGLTLIEAHEWQEECHSKRDRFAGASDWNQALIVWGIYLRRERKRANGGG